ncbi:MAG: hypothetical protein M5U33_04600 [Pseudorhodoplanes sp.]|nr:hypothetical protein [Pseudorhodoplanes sp.]
MVVEIDEVYMHCARAFLRSGLWQPETWSDPDDVPTLRAIMCEQKDLPPPDESAGSGRRSTGRCLLDHRALAWRTETYRGKFPVSEGAQTVDRLTNLISMSQTRYDY